MIADCCVGCCVLFAVCCLSFKVLVFVVCCVLLVGC